jgi:hypothetical protein
MFKNRVSRRIFGPKRGKGKKDLKKVTL